MTIYRIKNKINNKIYIGQTKDTLEARFAQHAVCDINRSAISKAIKKYGKENFEIEELIKANSQEQLDQLEKDFIKSYNSMAPNGYNLKTGGLEGSRYSAESRLRMSKRKIGTKASEETKKKMSLAHIERLKDPAFRAYRAEQYSKNYKNNKKLQDRMSRIRAAYWSDNGNRVKMSNTMKTLTTDQHKRLIGDRVKQSLQKPEIKEKIRLRTEKHQKKVVRSDGQIFNSIKEAAISTKTHESTIVKQLKGQYKTAGGFTFSEIKKPTIYLLIGAPASGKSWVASQLTDLYSYVSYDSNPKKLHLDLLRQKHDKPILFDPTFKISTIIRRHSDEFNFVIIAIQESESVLRDRMSARGGEWTDTILKRNAEIAKRYQKYGNGGLIGTSTEALEFLRQRASI